MSSEPEQLMFLELKSYDHFWKLYLTVQSYLIGRQEYMHSFPFALILYLSFVVVVVVIQSLSHVRLFSTPELQHARLRCPLPPTVCSNSCPLSWWCHPTILSSFAPFSSCPQSFPASGSFLMSWLFTSGGQSIGASASASVLPMNIQGWFHLGLTGLISWLSKGLSRVFSSIQLYQFFGTQPSLQSNSHIHTWLLEKAYLWIYGSLLASDVPIF